MKNNEFFPILGKRTYIQLPEKEPYFILLCKTFRKIKRLSLELKVVEGLYGSKNDRNEWAINEVVKKLDVGPVSQNGKKKSSIFNLWHW